MKARCSQVLTCVCLVTSLISCGYGDGDLRGFAPGLAKGELRGETYADFDRRRDGNSGSTFEDFPCLTPCTDHMAGYRWAEAQDEISAEECKKRSWAFTEGCIVYLVDVGAFEGAETTGDRPL